MKTLLFEESPEIILLLFGVMIFFNKPIVYSMGSVLMCMMLYFYRLPTRIVATTETETNVIVSPTDGTILKIEQLANGDRKIIIYLSVLNVHVQWYPVDGVVRECKYKPGEFNLAHILEKSDYNEKVSTIIDTVDGPIKIDQIAGQVARRIVNRSRKNVRVKRGAYMGMIKLSSRVDLYIPSKNTTLLVKPFDKVYGNLTLIAEWN